MGTPSVALDCEHDDSNYYYMYWYKHHPGGMDILAYSVAQGTVKIEPPFSDSKYKMLRPDIKISSLQINSIEATDSAVYYCASSMTH